MTEQLKLTESQPRGFKSQAGFLLGSIPSHVGLSPKLGFGWVSVPAHGFKSQSAVNGFSWHPRWDGDKVRKGLESSLGPKEVPGYQAWPGMLRRTLCCCLLICD